jgi:hypothetical protein
MMRCVVLVFVFLAAHAGPSFAQGCGALTPLVNGTNADANAVMANFNTLLTCLNTVSTPRSYLAGLTLSTPGASSTFSVAAGAAADSTNTNPMNLSSAISKTTLAWAVGTGNGALDTGSIAASTWYHVYLIKRVDTGVVDVEISLSASAPALPPNYALSRRIGSMKTNGSSQWTAFTQIGDAFLWNTPVTDVTGNAITTTATNFPLSVPSGVSVFADLQVDFANSAAAGIAVLVYSPLIGTQVLGTPIGNWSVNCVVASQYVTNAMQVWTNTSAQVSAVAQTSSNNSLFIITRGWIDRRGRDL